jgi:hypothetical protein
MQYINKTVRVGSGRYGAIFATIKLNSGRLSITGVEGPYSNGNCAGSCGQIDMHEWDISEFAPGWSPELVQQFREVWGSWHLNDMTAGSPAQRAFLKSRPGLARDYLKAVEALESAGLSPDPQYMHEGKPYKYGTAWLKREIPDAVIEFLKALPEADRALPKAWAN